MTSTTCAWVRLDLDYVAFTPLFSYCDLRLLILLLRPRR